MRPTKLLARQPQMVVVVALYLATLLSACSGTADTVQVHFQKRDGQNTPVVRAEIADSPGEIKLGLMYRKSLAEDEGMLFIFPDEKPRSFWMKNTYVELDMIFINAELAVVGIIERAVPLSTSGRPSGKPAKYVLEVPGGSVERWGLRPGDRLQAEGISLQ